MDPVHGFPAFQVIIPEYVRQLLFRKCTAGRRIGEYVGAVIAAVEAKLGKSLEEIETSAIRSRTIRKLA